MTDMRACLITGAAGGIGSVLCAHYRAAGWRVIATSRSADPGALSCDAYIQADMAELVQVPDTATQFAGQVRAALGGTQLHSLINNAALQVLGHTDEVTIDALRKSFDVNAIAPFALVQMFLPELRAAKGTVVNIGTVHAQSTKSAFVAYATSKTAMHGLTRALAVDLGPDIRVNTLAPAATATPMLMAGFDGKPEAFAALADAHPLGRIAKPEEIAKAALFLSGPDSSFMTGATVYADGGVLSRLHDPA